MKVAAIIVCAGRGKRLGVDKAILCLANKPLFYHAVHIFCAVREIKEIVLVMRREHFSRARRLLGGETRVRIVEGGSQRNHSVQNGLHALSRDITHVLIHDAARPFIPKGLIRRIIGQLKKFPAVICGLSCRDTVKAVRGAIITRTLNRRAMFFAQTPQGFRVASIRAAYARLGRRLVSDDAQVIEAVGGKIRVIEGSSLNFKITYPDDVRLARALAQYHE